MKYIPFTSRYYFVSTVVRIEHIKSQKSIQSLKHSKHALATIFYNVFLKKKETVFWRFQNNSFNDSIDKKVQNAEL